MAPDPYPPREEDDKYMPTPLQGAMIVFSIGACLLVLALAIN